MFDRRARMTAIEIAVVAAILFGLIAALYPAVRAARQAARRSQRLNDFKQIALGLRNFHDVYHRLPPAVKTDADGRRLSSWRFQLVPFMEAIMMHLDFGDRWDDPANRWLSSSPWHCFCWSPEAEFPKNLHTNVVAVTGPGTAFEEGREIGLKDLDGDTVLAVEIADSGIHWMEPGDLSIDDITESLLRGVEGDGLFVLFADASVWRLRSDVPLDGLTKFFTIEGAKRYDREEVLAPYADIR